MEIRAGVRRRAFVIRSRFEPGRSSPTSLRAAYEQVVSVRRRPVPVLQPLVIADEAPATMGKRKEQAS
jgi:hypothetical protein